MNQKITKNLYSFFGNEYQNNAFLLINNDNNECVVIDPSTYANEITLFIRENKLTLRGILLTHGHYDHYSSDEVLVNNFETKIYCPLKEKNVISPVMMAVLGGVAILAVVMIVVMINRRRKKKHGA